MERISRIQRIFRDIFDDDALRLEPMTCPENLGEWDSVAQVKIVLAVEEEFKVHFTTEEVSEIKSVRDLLACIDRHTGL